MAVAAVLLVLYYVMAVSGARQKSMTFDEMAHLTGGYTYWAFDDYRLHPENGNWPQRLGALPAIVERASFPASISPPGQTSNVYVIGDSSCTSAATMPTPCYVGARRMLWRSRRDARGPRLRVGQPTGVASRRVGEPRAVRVQSDAAGPRSARHVGHDRRIVLHGRGWCHVGALQPGDTDHRPRCRRAGRGCFLSKLSGSNPGPDRDRDVGGANHR